MIRNYLFKSFIYYFYSVIMFLSLFFVGTFNFKIKVNMFLFGKLIALI